MNTKTSLLVSAAISGALAVAPMAARGDAPPAKAPESGMEKSGCNAKKAPSAGKDKAGCNAKSAPSTGKEKSACGGKDGCGGKDKQKKM